MPRNLSPHRWRPLFILSLLLGGGLAGQARAAPLPRWDFRTPPAVQPPSLAIPAPPRRQSAVRWYHGIGALGAVALVALADESLQEELQAHRSEGKDDVARVFKRMGEPPVYVLPALGSIAAGVILGDDRVTRAGGRITAGLVTAGVVTNLLKPLVGRRRPTGNLDAFEFTPFSNQDSWPSGHTAMAFALATGLGDELHSTPVTVLLYGAAGLTSWSRLNDNRHWGSDVLAGALVGITSVKLMNGRWRVFGIRAPRFLLEPGAVGLTTEF